MRNLFTQLVGNVNNVLGPEIDTRKSNGKETSAKSADVKGEEEGQRTAVYEDFILQNVMYQMICWRALVCLSVQLQIILTMFTRTLHVFNNCNNH